MTDISRNPPDQDTLNRMIAVVGPKGAVTDLEDQKAYLCEWRDRFEGRAALIVRPSSTEQVAAIVKIACETNTALVPQGGNTGLVGGQIPSPEGSQVIVSLDRMTEILEVDPRNNTMTVQAGCILTTIQEKAADAGLLFPLSLASEGSARIGGLMSTNAGGVNVLRYGNARDLALGLEVVTPSGDVWSDLHGLRKDNTGYDLKQLFIGAEGTLGIITKVTLKLYPRPTDHVTALVAVDSIEAAVGLLPRLLGSAGHTISAFELMPKIAFEYLRKHKPGFRPPMQTETPWTVLIELDDICAQGTLADKLENVLGGIVDGGAIIDAVIAKNEKERHAFWDMRESLSEIQKFEGGSLKHDISLPISNLAAFVDAATEAVENTCPGIRPFIFGHLGDGNLHFNFSQPVDADKTAFLSRSNEIARVVHDLVAEYGGSFSAEHGIGQLKREELIRYKSQTEIDMMRAIKHALDPKGIMNPGKVL